MFYPHLLVSCPKMGLLLEYMVLETVTQLFQAIVINVRLVYKILHKLALFSILLFKCTILDYLPASQIINEKETLIINKFFCFKTSMS